MFSVQLEVSRYAPEIVLLDYKNSGPLILSTYDDLLNNLSPSSSILLLYLSVLICWIFKLAIFLFPLKVQVTGMGLVLQQQEGQLDDLGLRSISNYPPFPDFLPPNGESVPAHKFHLLGMSACDGGYTVYQP